MEVVFVNFNGIKEYARVMYNDVKDADKYRIDVAYNGRDVKDLLEYLFDIEQKLEEKENIIKEERQFLENILDCYIKPINENEIIEIYYKEYKRALEILDKENK